MWDSSGRKKTRNAIPGRLRGSQGLAQSEFLTALEDAQ